MQEYLWAFFWGEEKKRKKKKAILKGVRFFVCFVFGFSFVIFFRPYQEILERKKMEKNSKEIHIVHFCLRIGSKVIARVMKMYYHCTYIYQNFF